MARVPLRDVLPPEYVSAEEDLRSLAAELDGRRSAVWHWYPDRTEPYSVGGGYVLLVDVTIPLHTSRYDWLELTLDISWRPAPTLTVNAAVEVACWCPQNHNTHQVRRAGWHVANSPELVQAFAAGTAMLAQVIDSGPFEASAWRLEAELPDVPEAYR